MLNCAIILLQAFLSLLLPAHKPLSGDHFSSAPDCSVIAYGTGPVSLLENSKQDNRIGIVTDSFADDDAFVEETDNDEVHNENTQQSTGKKRFSTAIQARACYHEACKNYQPGRPITAGDPLLPAGGTSLLVFISQYRL